MRVLVTGATGFIGKNMVEGLLKNGYEVTCVSRRKIAKDTFKKPVKNIVLDLQEIEKIEKYMEDIDVIIHIAAQLGHYGIPYQYYYQVNYLATAKLAKLAVKYDIKQFILCSAPFVVGLGGRNTKEEEPYSPADAYSETKMLAELGVIHICEGKIPYTILRPSYVYGKEDVRRTALYRSIKKKYFVLTTTGKAYLQPTYVSDIVDGFLLAILNKKAYNEIINLGGAECLAKEYLECIARHVNSKLIHINIGYPLSIFIANIVDYISKKILHKAGFVNRGRIDFFAKDHSCNLDKAKKLLGYQPKVNLEKGIRMSIQWSKQNGYL